MKCKYILTIVTLALLTGISFALPKPPLSTPTLSCAGNTGSSINITFTAGSTGAPAGFSIQWITAEALAANNGVWPSDETQFCKASFSGNASGYNYSLAAGANKTVTLGDTLFDTPGASSPCDGVALTCGTAYVFRAFAHANSTYNRSAFSANTTCSTASCGGGGCTFTQGYWKTHGPTLCLTGNNTNQWPADVQANGLALGTTSYTDSELCSIFNTPAQGNGLISLAHQLIAAKLNVANGADSTQVTQTIADADALIAGYVIPPVGGDALPNASTSALTATLTSYNEGSIGPGHCQ